ncbi:MAG: penicillin-binding protein 1C, partial [Calditrichaeota bacterium]
MKTFRKIKIKIGATILVLTFFLLPVVKLDQPSSTVVFDHRGILLGATVAADGQWRFPGAAKLPTKFTQALLCYEDRRFYLHSGFDLVSLCRAMRDNLRAKHIVSGGSTITMQVVRLARHGQRRTIIEKMIEMVLAIRLEWAIPKRQILAVYAANAPFGGNVVGLEAAAWRYFGRPSEELSWAESAMLAVLPNSPALIHPGRNRLALETKRNRLLRRLYQIDKIDSLTYALATAEPLPGKPLPLPMTAPHLVQRIFLEQHGQGGRIITTLDATLQKRCSSVLNRRMKGLLANSIGNAAALVLDLSNGAALVYLGNVTNDDPQHHPQVDIITSPRSTGSLLKPFLYAGMLESGEILPTTLVPDIPTQMGSFAPKNYNRGYEGAVPAFRALARSLNVPAVRMLHLYGVDRFYDLLLSIGLTTLFRPAKEYGLSLILGGAEGTLWDLTAAYAYLARCAVYRSAYIAPHILQEDDPKKGQDSHLQEGKTQLSLE